MPLQGEKLGSAYTQHQYYVENDLVQDDVPFFI